MSATTRRITLVAVASTALFAALAVAPPVFASAPSGASRPDARPQAVEGSNWAGYVATGSTYTSVSASWVQPSVKCASGQTTYTSNWVGLDGYNNSALEQTGTEEDCIDGTAEYGAWWEVLPGAESPYSVTVLPGDRITASVTYLGSSNFTMTLTDSTQGWTKSTTHKGSSGFQNSSAEIIVENTSVGGVVTQSGDVTVTFDDCLIDGAALGSFDPVPITSPFQSVSPITDGGESFTVQPSDGVGP